MTKMKGWFKRHHWMHSWSRWETKVYTVQLDDGKTGDMHFQHRECSTCGLRQSLPV